MTFKVKYRTFLKDVFLCSLASYGGPEAHYGVFSSYLVEEKGYLAEDDLAQMIGLYSLVPGPSSTQTITAIGYYKGGALLALLTFLVWALPAILTMTLFGLAFSNLAGNDSWSRAVKYLPIIALSFILFGGIMMAKKQVKRSKDLIFFSLVFLAGFFLIDKSIWAVPTILITSGLFYQLGEEIEISSKKLGLKPKYWILILIIGIAFLNELISGKYSSDLFTVFKNFYRYGYSVIGGGQVVIPLMIQDFVESLSMVSLEDFMVGYAIDQAIPGPLFSFASFVGASALSQGSMGFIGGLLAGLSVFAPGILMVMFMAPIWNKLRANDRMKVFFKGIGIGACALIFLTAYRQFIGLSLNMENIIIGLVAFVLLFSKKLPAPLIIVAGVIIGLVF